jgi:Immunoglobulin I-set domain
VACRCCGHLAAIDRAVSPVVHVPNQLIWSSVGSNLTMECFIEASPRSMNFWVKGAGELILSGSKYTLSDVRDSIFAGRMALTIHSFQKSDVGTYRCVAKNSLGEVEGRIQVYGKAPDNRRSLAYLTRWLLVSRTHGRPFHVSWASQNGLMTN